MCPKEQAKAWALREAWRELRGESTYGMCKWIAARVFTVGNPPKHPSVAQGIWPAVTLRSRASVRNARISGAVTLTLFGALKLYKQLGWGPGGVRPAPLLQHCREAMSPNGVSNTQV